MTNEMCKLLHATNPRLLFAKHIREIKEKLSFTSLKPEQELVSNSRYPSYHIKLFSKACFSRSLKQLSLITNHEHHV